MGPPVARPLPLRVVPLPLATSQHQTDRNRDELLRLCLLQPPPAITERHTLGWGLSLAHTASVLLLLAQHGTDENQLLSSIHNPHPPQIERECSPIVITLEKEVVLL